MENEKTPLYVAFSTQKGGVGKTTFTVLAASYLYYLKGYDVAVVCLLYTSYPQAHKWFPAVQVMEDIAED